MRILHFIIFFISYSSIFSASFFRFNNTQIINHHTILRLLLTAPNLNNPWPMSKKQRIHCILSLVNISAASLIETFIFDKSRNCEATITKYFFLIFMHLIYILFHWRISYWLDKKFDVPSNHWNIPRDTAIIIPTVYSIVMSLSCFGDDDDDETM